MKEEIKLTPAEALQILRNAARGVQTNLDGHELMQKALHTLFSVVDKPESKDASK